jgi:hypothetical protein
MNKLIFLATTVGVFLLVSSFTTRDSNNIRTETSIVSDYCDGWEDGYCEGWKDVKGSMALCPLTPLCPLSELGKDRYRDGYNRGFKAGSRAANK